eukprot:8031119-Alexandrium_andersonii.AAC.1
MFAVSGPVRCERPCSLRAALVNVTLSGPLSVHCGRDVKGMPLWAWQALAGTEGRAGLDK